MGPLGRIRNHFYRCKLTGGKVGDHARVFGAQETSAGGRLVRTIGIVRARAKIGLQNLVYNIRRLVTLESMAAA